MSFYFRNGNTYRIADERSIQVEKALPVGTYIVKYDQMAGQYFLEMVDDFTPLSKYYGSVLNDVKRVFSSFEDRPATTGVMLSGEKGSGKTLLAKELSIEGYRRGMPTLVINQDFTGDVFNKFIQDINQPAVILFDEFEKVYDNKTQESILTLLDGTFPTKKLFVMTCNDKWRIDSHMRNRPGRIYYFYDFEGLEKEFIEQYCYDNLKDTSHIPQIIAVASLFKHFNFDMLKAMVEEMNRYNESPQQVLRLLNVKPEHDSGSDIAYDVVIRNIVSTHLTKSYTKSIMRSPLSLNAITIEMYDDENEDNVVFFKEDIYSLDGTTGTYRYRNEKGDEIDLVRRKTSKFDIFQAL